MSAVVTPRSEILARRLEELSRADHAYWAFSDKDDRDYVHGLFHYPAMMVPKMQRVLIEECLAWDPSIRTIYDPFVGSGTVMTEAMLAGRDFVGTDINPLAILISQAKAGLFNIATFERSLRKVLERVERDQSDTADVEFPGRDKWFEPKVQVALSKLRRSVDRCSDVRVRRFWWVVMAETTRLVSNSRTSTVKLHIRPRAEIEARTNDAVATFGCIARRSLRVLGTQAELLAERQFLDDGVYSGSIDLRVADVAAVPLGRQADLLVSSPPYGDNHTTVTYGQAAYLPLQWVRRSDVDAKARPDYFTNTAAIDSASLGGCRINAMAGIDSLLDRSAGLRTILDHLASQPRDRAQRVAVFFKDFDQALNQLLAAVRTGGLMVWTVGDRSVGGVRVPLAAILRQLVGERAELVTLLERTIPQGRKRMPTRNSITATMGTEQILVLRSTP
jgi:site-specific DNA-methyltransferase (cytosine-N4-specific)